MLEEVRARPKQLLGEISCSLLEAFIGGWTFGAYRCDQLVDIQDQLFRQFGAELSAKYGTPSTVFNAFSQLRLLAGDTGAFHLFFEELNLFANLFPDCLAPRAQSAGKKISRAEVIASIRRKPGLYLGRKSVSRLRAFLDGDAYAFKKSGLAGKIDPDLDEFEKWLMANEGMRSQFRWERVILLYANQNEEIAFDLFFDRLDEWEAQKAK